MITAAYKALAQILSPPFRRMLWKAAGLALLLVVIAGVALHRLLVWLAGLGEGWADAALGPAFDTPLMLLVWGISIAAGLGILLGSIFLMPAVTSFVASFFVDEIAEQVERAHYPADPPGRPVPMGRSLLEGLKTAALAVGVYLVAVPFLLFGGLGAVLFFVAAAYLLSREYFELAAMRFRSPAEAKALRKQHAGAVFAAGFFIAALVSIPIVNLITPLFGMAMMVHLHKQLAGPRVELIEPERRAALR